MSQETLSTAVAVKDKRNEDILNVLEFWRKFDLEERKIELDKQVMDIRDTKSKSIAGRKHLNEITKSFRSKSREEQLTLMQDILKSYQGEIDQLSRRAKSSEAAFLDIYKALYDGPDPTPIIDSLYGAQTQNSSQQLEISRLRSELSQYDEEFKRLKNQDITIRRLEDQINEYRESIEDQVNEEVAKQVAEVESVCAQTVAEVREHHRAAEKRLAISLEATQAAQQAADRAQSRLFEASSQAEAQFTALQVENTMITENSDRLRARVVELENDLLNLRRNTSKFDIADSSGGNDNGASLSSDETSEEKIEVMQGLLKELRAELISKEEIIAVDRNKHEGIVNELKHKIALTSQDVAQFRKELANRPHLDELLGLKRQVKVLQKVIFNAEDDCDDDEIEKLMNDIDNSTLAQLSIQHNTPFPELADLSSNHNAQLEQQLILEKMLVARLKSIQGELIEARGRAEAAFVKEKQALEEVTKLKSDLVHNQELVRKLESDLESTSFGGQAQGILKKISPGSKSGGGVSAPDASLVALLSTGDDGPSQHDVMINQKDTKHSSSGESQMMAILTSQRDRYKERLDTLEGSLVNMKDKLSRIESEKNKLIRDNTALFEKIRYLQNYSQASKSSQRYSGSIESMESGMSGNSIQQSMDLSKLEYSNIYEQQMSPAAVLSQLERQKKMKELSVTERILLSTTVQIVSTKAGRTAMMFYLGAMHFLVFCTLYYVAHNTHGSCTGGEDLTTDHGIINSVTHEGQSLN